METMMTMKTHTPHKFGKPSPCAKPRTGPVREEGGGEEAEKKGRNVGDKGTEAGESVVESVRKEDDDEDNDNDDDDDDNDGSDGKEEDLE